MRGAAAPSNERSYEMRTGRSTEWSGEDGEFVDVTEFRQILARRSGRSDSHHRSESDAGPDFFAPVFEGLSFT